MRTTNKLDSDFVVVDPPSLPACTHGGQDIKKIPQGATCRSPAVAAEAV